MCKNATLIRWTIGPVHDCGFDVLAASVQYMHKVYPEFDQVICHNQLSIHQLEKIGRLGVTLVDQSEHVEKNIYPPRGGYAVEWKLYPPRIRPQSHEIFMDNDIVLCKRMKIIDEWLNASSNTLLYQGLHGFHGSYSGAIPKGVRINSGIFGLPPNFQFGEKIAEHIRPFSDYFDEQGLVAKILTRETHRIIPLTVVPIVENDWPLDAHDNNQDCCGYHFVGANKGEHPAFRKFQNRSVLI
jgi:hypothetical protein